MQNRGTMTDWKWTLENPKESGYYLATWKHRSDGRSRRVSEFWFDGTNWWSGRRYIYLSDTYATAEELACVTDLVIAWTHKPMTYRGAYDVRREGHQE